MTAVEQAALPGPLALGELEQLVDERTRAILERRRRSAVVRRRGWLVRRALAFADIAGLVSAFLVAQWVFGVDDGSAVDRIDSRTETLIFLLTLPAWIVVAKLYGLYDRDEERTDHSTADDVVGVFHMVTVGTWLFFAGAWATGWADPQLTKLVLFWALATAAVPTLRAAARACSRRHAAYVQNTIIVGAGRVGRTVARKVLNHPEYGLNVVGFVGDHVESRPTDVGQPALLGGSDRLKELVENFDVERVIVAFPGEPDERTVDLVRELQTLDVQIDVVPRLYELVSPGVGLHTIEGLPVLGLPPIRLSRSSALLKRTMDVVLATAGLALLAPAFLVVATAVRLDSPGPVFFRQTRMGTDGPFRIWKFRTMWADADARKREFAHLNKHLGPDGDPRMFKIDDDPRVTRVGRLLRRYSLDELPQLFNVVRGEMSLVGPRPLILEEDSCVDAWAQRRLTLKPGITGLWQALGRDAIPFHEMVKLDYVYVTSWTPFMDLTLVLKTLPAVVRTSRRSFR